MATPGVGTRIAASPAPPVPGVVQQVPGRSYSEYGLHAIEITAQPGNALIVFAGWCRNYLPSPAPVPACYVSDSAGNKWYHLATSDPGNSGARCCIWACPSIMPVGGEDQPPGWVSVSLTGFAASLAYSVVEMDSMPSLIVPDIAVTSSDPAVTTSSVTVAGKAQSAGPGLTMLCAGGSATTLADPPAGWTALSPVSAGDGAQDGVIIWPFVLPEVTPGLLPAAYGVSGPAPLAAALVTLQPSPREPVFPNPDMPGLAFSIAPGHLPGDVSAAPPPLADITQRCIAGNGKAWLSYSYGHEYPLSGPEAGTLTLAVRNSDGALTPGNVSSPYWTNSLTPNPGFRSASTGADGLAVISGSLEGWTPAGNAGLAVQDQYTCDGSWAAVLTPDGVTANPGLATAVIPVSSSDYGATIWFLLTADATVTAAFTWMTGSGTVLGTSTSSVAGTAGTWAQVAVRSAAYPGAVRALATFALEGVQTALSYWAIGGICPGGQSVQAGGVDDLLLVHADAWWDGRWYDLATGWVQGVPAEWPELAQYGMSRLRAADSIAILAACTLPSAVQGEILADNPHAYLPCSEQYLTVTNGIASGSFTLSSVGFSEAQGLPAANMALHNQRAGMYADGGGTQAETGLALNLLGDQGTGMGASSYSGTVTSGAGPGVIYADPDLPSPLNGTSGLALECWFVQSDSNGPTLLTAYSSSSPYITSSAPVLLGAGLTAVATGSTRQLVIFLPGTALPLAYKPSQDPQHLALLLGPQPSATLYAYLNGKLAGSKTLPEAAQVPWSALTLGSARYSFGPVPALGNYVLGHAAVHACQLSPARVAAHYSAGAYGTVSGPAGDLPQVRLAAILTWGQLGIPRGGPLTYQGATEPVLLGPAYDTGGSPAVQALGTIMTSEGGMAAVMPSGVLTYLPRWWLYNLPSTITFGDADNPAEGEIPFRRGQGWDLDTTYLYDQTAITRVSGPTTSVTAAWRDIASSARYFTRPALTQQIETASDYDAYDASTWYAAQYGTPQLRLRTLTVDAASNPSQAFPAMLSLRPGAVSTANRRPIGGWPVSTVVQAQKITLDIGPGRWKYTIQASPYAPQGSVLQADTREFSTLGGASALPR